MVINWYSTPITMLYITILTVQHSMHQHLLHRIMLGMVMFLLSLQTGLIDTEMPHRIGAMSVILFIVAASLFQVCYLFS